MKIYNKVNILLIIKNHAKTLVNNNTGKHSFDDLFTFIISPLIIAIAFYKIGITLSPSSVNVIITILSILVGLMFNVIVIVFDIVKRDNSKKIKNKVLNQLLTNISYSILLAILVIVIALFAYLEEKSTIVYLTFGITFLVTHYMFTVLMILKRMYIIFMNEMKDIEENTN